MVQYSALFQNRTLMRKQKILLQFIKALEKMGNSGFTIDDVFFLSKSQVLSRDRIKSYLGYFYREGILERKVERIRTRWGTCRTKVYHIKDWDKLRKFKSSLA